jgi:hypothetical protein
MTEPRRFHQLFELFFGFRKPTEASNKWYKRSRYRKSRFELLEDRRVLSGQTLYVNDNWAVTNDVAPAGLSAGDTVANTSAGDDGTVTGKIFDTNAFSTIQGAINAANPGDTIDVLAGTYFESNILVTKSLTIQGQSRAGVILGPSVADGHIDSAFAGPVSNGFVIQSSGVTIQDLTIDGNANAALNTSSGQTQNFRAGVSVDFNAGEFDDTVVTDASFKNIYRRGASIYDFMGTRVTTGNVVSDSSFDEIGTDPNLNGDGYAIIMVQSSGSITDNTITNSGNGIATNFSTQWPTYAPTITISGNNISAFASTGVIEIGIYAVGLALDSQINNNIIDTTGDTQVDDGIVLTYLSDVRGTQLQVEGNQITTDKDDVAITVSHRSFGVSPTYTPVLVSGNTLLRTGAGGSGQDVGIVVSDTDNLGDSNDNSGGTLSTNMITGYHTGIMTENLGGFLVTAAIGGNTITGVAGSTGISIGNGTTASVDGNIFSANAADLVIAAGGTVTSLTSNVFTGTQYIENLSTGDLDATTDSFNVGAGNAAVLGSNLTLSEAFAVEDRIVDAVDSFNYGFVRIQSGQVFETPNSFFAAGGTTTPDVARPIAIASPGDTVNIEAGTYTLQSNITINKPLTLLGPNVGITPRNGGPSRVPEAIINGGTPGSFTGSSSFSFVTGTGSTTLAVKGLKFTNFDGNMFNMGPQQTSFTSLQNIFDTNNGAIFYKGDPTNLTVFDVEDNRIANQTTTGYNTATIFLGGVTNSHFDNNEVANTPNRELINVFGSLTNTTFSHNSLTTTGGLALLAANQNNVTFDDNTITSTNTAAGVGAIYVSTNDGRTVTNLHITNNNITTVTGGGIGIRISTDTATSASITGVTISGNTIAGTSTYGIDLDTFATSGTGTIDTVAITNNQFTNNAFGPILAFARPTSGTNQVKNLTVDGNTFNENAGIYTASFYLNDFRNVSGTNSFSGNSFTLSGTLPGGTDAVRVVGIRGSQTGNWNINDNNLQGGGVTHNNSPTVFVSGIVLLSKDASTGNIPASSIFNIGGNFINGFEDGIAIRDGVTPAYGGLAAGTIVTVLGNDLSGNSLFSLRSGASGAMVNASGNWWGTNTSAGVASKTTVNVDYTPWLDVGTDVGGNPANGFQGSFSTLDVDINSPQSGAVPRIQEGVNLLADGLQTGANRVVNVLAGTYNELVAMDKSGKLRGTQAGVDPRAGRAGAETIISNGQGDVQVLADNVTVDGFTLTGVTTSPNVDPGALGAAIWTNPVFSGTHGGLQALNNIIQGNIAGIELDNDGTYQTKVQYNLFQNNNAPGPNSGLNIEVDFGLINAVIDSNKFTNTALVVDSWAFGVEATSGSITFSNNDVSNLGRGIFFYLTDGVTISGNTIAGTSNYAIGIFNAFGTDNNANFDILNNTLNGNNKFISLDGYTGDLDVTGNSITGGNIVFDIADAQGFDNLNLTNNSSSGNTTGGSIDNVTNLNLTTSANDDTVNLNANGLSVGQFNTNVLQTTNYSNITTIHVATLGGDDQVNVGADPTTLIDLDGGPNTPTGDTLTYYTNGSPFNFGANTITTTGSANITFTNFENYQTSGVLSIVGSGNDDEMVITATGTSSGTYQLIQDYTGGSPNVGPVVAFVNATSFQFSGLGGNDRMIINNPAGGVFAPTGGVFYDGDAGTDDLQIVGGLATSVEHVFTNANDGFVKYNGTTAITYTGLSPIDDSIVVTNRIFTFNNAGNAIAVTDGTANDNRLHIVDPGNAEAVDFTDPTGSLTINVGTGTTNSVTISSVDAQYRAALTINGSTGTDTVNLNAALTLGSATSSGSVSVTADAINLGANISTDANGTSAGSIALTGSVVLTTNVSLDTNASTSDGTITVTGAISGPTRILTIDTGSANDINFSNAANDFGTVAIASARNVTLVDSNSIVLGNVASTSLTVPASGSITNTSTATINVSGTANLAAGGNPITLGTNGASDAVNFGSLTFSGSAVNIALDSGTSLTSTSTASSLILSSTGAITNAASASLAVTNNASLSAASVNLGNQSGDVVNFGSLTFNATGAVSIAEDSATSLVSTNTANSLILSSTGTITNAASASLTVTNNASFSGTSIDLGNQSGDIMNFGSLDASSAGTVTISEDSSSNLNLLTASTLTLVSAGAIIDNNGASNNIAATDVTLTAPTGIGAGNSLETSISNLAASGGSGGVFITNSGSLTIKTVGLLSGIAASSGNIDVSTTGDLTINQPVTASAGTTHLTGGAGGGGSVITLSAAVTGTTVLVNGGAGSDTITVNTTVSSPITLDGLNGGDSYILNLANPITATLNISDSGASGIDQATISGTSSADTFNVSETQTTLGAITVTYTTTLEQLRINSLAGTDTFNVSPSRYAAITVDGGSPSFGQPGTPPNVDSLIFNALGNSVSLVGNTILTSGGTPSFQGVSFIDIENLPFTPLGTSNLHFDFNGSASSPTQAGYTGVLPTRLYGTGTPSSDYGWLTTLPTGGFDRGTIAGYTLSDLMRDGQYGGSGASGARTFQADVTNGYYLVSVKMGDSGFTRDQMRVTNNDTGQILLDNVTNTAGPTNFANVKTFVINVTDGTMDLKFSDQGGDPYWVVNALDIRPAVLLTEGFAPQGPLTSDGITVDSFTASGATPNAEVTVTTTLGTITTADVDPKLAGLQLMADGSGQIPLSIQRPTGGGAGVVLFEEVSGAKTGMGLVTYVVPSTRFFDFNKPGSPNSPTQSPSSPPTIGGYFGVLPTDLYTSAKGYGWNIAAAGGFDGGALTGPESDLRRDGNFGTGGPSGARIFQADLPNGSYLVNITMGDSVIGRNAMQVKNTDTGDILVSNLTTPAGSFFQTLVPVTVTDGSLNLEFSDLGGGDPNWVVNGIEIRPTAAVNPIFFTTGPGLVSADGVTTDTITGATSLPAGSVVTVTTSLGTITTDTNAAYLGTQATVVAGGGIGGAPNSFTFQVLRPAVAGTPTFTATSVDGSALGTATNASVLSYQLAPVRRFDFGPTASPTATGFIGVSGSTVFSPTLGYGWSTAVGDFDHGTTGTFPVTTIPLYQDGSYGTSGPANAGTFNIQVNPGLYSLRIYVGDHTFARDQIQVTVEGGSGPVIVPTTAINQFVTVTLSGQDINSDGRLEVRIQDLGGDPSWVINGLDIAQGGIGNLPAGAPQQSLGQGPGGAAAGPLLTSQALAPIVQDAIARWQAAGISSQAVAMLQSVKFQIADLDASGDLGSYYPGSVLIDDNADGFGWYVDPTPDSDAEFATRVAAAELQAGPGSPAFGRVDLLTVVMHELGHQLGLADLDPAAAPHDLLTESLGTGTRRLPDAWPGSPAASTASASSSVSDSVFATLGSSVGTTAPLSTAVSGATPQGSSTPLKVEANLPGLQPALAILPTSTSSLAAGSPPRKTTAPVDAVFTALGQ